MNSYKGYTAKVEFSYEDMMLVGYVEHIDALVMFSAENASDIESEFHAAVDQYLSDCEENGVAADKAYKGSFNVRIGAENHRKLANTARQWNISLNELMRIASEQVVDRFDKGTTVTIAQKTVPLSEPLYTRSSANPGLTRDHAYKPH